MTRRIERRATWQIAAAAVILAGYVAGGWLGMW